MQFRTKQVDYTDPRDVAEFVRLQREYMAFENCSDTSDASALPKMLDEFPTAFSILAYEALPDPSDAIGLVNCFFGFSTFRRQRLVNIHDVIVTETRRGQGVSAALLDAVERIAVEHGCCRLTLEVYANNASARRAYEKYGFTRDPSQPDVDTHFLRKTL